MMKNNFSKYLILVLIALFFASTSEVCTKEAEMNYKTERHSFLDTGSYTLNISRDNFQNDLTKAFHAFSFADYPGTCSSLNFLPGLILKNAPPLISKHRYLDNSILRI